jgi:hypothetical protein
MLGGNTQLKEEGAILSLGRLRKKAGMSQTVVKVGN